MVAESQCSTFQTKRHKHFPTIDVPLRDMPQSYQQFYPLLQSTVYPYVRKKYKLRDATFNVVDLFVVKYSSRGQDELKEHRDGSILSFNILLNRASEFRGGGTKFSGIQGGLTIRNEKGGCIFHCGKLKHSGVKIVGRDSVRFILVGFLNVKSSSLVDDARRLSLRSLTSDDEYLRGLYVNEVEATSFLKNNSTATEAAASIAAAAAGKKIGNKTTRASSSGGLLSCFRPKRKKFPQTLPNCTNWVGQDYVHR